MNKPAPRLLLSNLGLSLVIALSIGTGAAASQSADHYLAGRILYGQHDPLPGASVDVSCGVQPLFELSTDSAGWFEAPRPVSLTTCSQAEVTLTILRPGFHPTQKTVALSDPVVFVAVQLTPIGEISSRYDPIGTDAATFTVHGLVRNETTGEPIAGAYVALRVLGERPVIASYERTVTYSRESGFFSMFLSSSALGAKATFSLIKEGFASANVEVLLGAQTRESKRSPRLEFLDEQGTVPAIGLEIARPSRWRLAWDLGVVRPEDIPDLQENASRFGASIKFFPFGTARRLSRPKGFRERLYLGLGGGLAFLNETGRGRELRTVADAAFYIDAGFRINSFVGIGAGVGFLQDRNKRYDSVSVNLSLLLPVFDR